MHPCLNAQHPVKSAAMLADSGQLRLPGTEKSPSRSPPLRSPSAGGPARRVSDADSDAGDYVDASEALTTESSPGRVL